MVLEPPPCREFLERGRRSANRHGSQNTWALPNDQLPMDPVAADVRRLILLKERAVLFEKFEPRYLGSYGNWNFQAGLEAC
jgi:hypothetical protein